MGGLPVMVIITAPFAIHQTVLFVVYAVFALCDATLKHQRNLLQRY